MMLAVPESMTVPLIFNATVGLFAFEVTVIVFRIGLTLFVSYFTSISPLSPGKIGAVGFFGTVHPQVDFTADTTKQLKETMLLDITHISSELVFDSNFIRKFNSNLKQQQLTEISSNQILFRDKPTFYSEAKGFKNKFKYSVLNLFIKLNEKNYIHSTIEVYGDSLRRKRICKGINLLEKAIF